MARFPVLLQHMDAAGIVDGTPVRASIVSAVAPALIARGADRLLIPAPAADELDRISEGLAALPRPRRRLVKVVDEDGRTWKRVVEYLRPLGRQARKWPENAFVSFALQFLYELTLASKYKAGVATDSVNVVRGFVPIIDPTVFTHEARFRLAELLALICRYDPAAPDHIAYRTDVAASAIGPTAL